MRGLYRPLSQHGHGKNDKEDFYRNSDRLSLPAKWRSVVVVLSVLLFCSLSANVLQYYHRLPQKSSCNELPTEHAHLQRNVPKDFAPPPEYSSPNQTIQDAAWDSPRLISWELYVALDDQYSAARGLPYTQRWPWDSSKGVYILNAAHELHCVLVLRSVLIESHNGVPEDELSWKYTHAIHCLNVLRELVMCNADDRPLYVGRLHKNAHAEHHLPGNGMMRMCRDWDALMDWAHKNSACYLSVHREDPNFDELDRYKYCPDGARPWENMISEQTTTTVQE